MVIKLIIKKPSKEISEAYLPYNRNAWTVDFSYAWISPEGELNLVPDGSSHDAWACNHFNRKFNEENSAISTYELSTSGWIRMSNAHDINVNKYDEISFLAWDAYAKDLTKGMPRNIDPEKYIVQIGININSQGWAANVMDIPLAELISRKCSKPVQKEFFDCVSNAIRQR